jgi:hypothetical protein
MESLHQLVEHVKSNATHWAGLLGATGGAPELSKCSYHVLYWKFSIQGAPVLSNMKSEIEPLSAVDLHTEEVCELEYINPYQAHKTLGHHKEPAGTQAMQFNKLNEKSDTNTEFLWSTPLTRSEAWT